MAMASADDFQNGGLSFPYDEMAVSRDFSKWRPFCLFLNVMLCDFQHGGSLVLEGNMARQFQNGGITFRCRVHDSRVPRWRPKLMI
jgi:hypothetical protein